MLKEKHFKYKNTLNIRASIRVKKKIIMNVAFTLTELQLLSENMSGKVVYLFAVFG